MRAEIIISSQPKAYKGIGGEWTILCPWHDEKTPSCCVNVIKKVFICHGCGEKGRLHKLIARLQGIDLKEAARLIGDSFVYEESHNGKLTLPPEYHGLFGPRNGCFYSAAKGYLKSRRITDEQIFKYKIGYCSHGKFAKRIIIPVTYKGKLVSFIARDWTNRSKLKIRYPSGAQHVWAIFGYDFAFAYASTVVITEGWADALAVERALKSDSFFDRWAAVALGGKDVSAEKMLMLKSFDRFVIMLDSDAEVESKILEEKLSYFNKPIRRVLVPAKDPADADEKILTQILR